MCVAKHVDKKNSGSWRDRIELSKLNSGIICYLDFELYGRKRISKLSFYWERELLFSHNSCTYIQLLIFLAKIFLDKHIQVRNFAARISSKYLNIVRSEGEIKSSGPLMKASTTRNMAWRTWPPRKPRLRLKYNIPKPCRLWNATNLAAILFRLR